MRTSPEVLGRTLATAPDPELARVALSRVGEDAGARDALEEHLEAAAALLGFSTAAADLLAAHPEETEPVLSALAAGREQLDAELAADVRRFGDEAGLRRFRRRAVWRLAARDLLGAPVDDVMTEMTNIAEVCLLRAAAMVGDVIGVIGMGKLGGGELNYASDVDVIFVHDESAGDAARAAQRFIALLAEPTVDGVALRIDADLRPEGRSGALSRSLPAMAEYYRRHAATWERQALVKARPVAGDTALAGRLLEELEPLIYPEHLETSTIEDVRAMKVRIEEYVRARGKQSVEVKRGSGGIRDVEFSVQLLQLVHGRRDPRLRERGTLPALTALAEEGYVALDDAGTLADSYRFLRRLEHRLQLHRELQTHELPSDPAALRRIGRSLGLDGADGLAAAHAEHTGIVRGLHERLFYRPLLEAFAGPGTPRPGRDRVATEELLSGLGFRRPDAAYERLSHLVSPATRTGKVLAHVFPVMAPALALAAEPDAALVRLERIVEGRDEREADAIASDPELARRMALLAGTSAWLSDVLVRTPVDVLRQDAVSPAEPALLAAGAAYVAGSVGVPDIGRRLTRIADAAVAEALDAAAPQVPVAVIGMGKLGAEELNFASDLDVVFVFDGEGPEEFQEAERAAEAVLRWLGEHGFEPDADLRPEGRSGPLARSMAAFLEYWQRWGQTWEFQALLKARHVAGDEQLARRFLSAASDLAYPEVLPLERVAEIRRMRVRMENERVKPPDARRFHLKLGYGGLADIQFAVELALMRHGREHREVRLRHTLDALESLARARLVEDSVALALGEAYVFLNEVKNALELERRVAADALPASPEEQLTLARRLGYEEGARRRFMEDYRRITRRARRAMERVFYEEEA